MIDKPGEHPEPPGDLASRPALRVTFDPGTIFVRIHNRDHGPIFFGRTGANRFDSPDKTFGVLYVGRDEFCAFIETFGHDTGTRVVTRIALEQRHFSYLRNKNALTLIDLASSGALARLGADSRLFSGSHAIAQRWSAALHLSFPEASGLLYPARHDPARYACALFDLPASALEATPSGSLLDPQHVPLLAEILDRYDFGLID